MRWLRRAGIAIAVLAAAAAVLAVLGLAALRLYFTDERLTEIAVRELDDRLEGSFTVERLSYDFPSTLSVDGFVARAPDGEVVVSLQHARGRVDLAALLGKRLRITSVEATGADARLEDQAAGVARAFRPRVAASERAPAGRGGFSVRILVDRLSQVHVRYSGAGVLAEVANGSVRDGRLRYRNGQLDITGELRLPDTQVRVAQSAPPVTGSLRARAIFTSATGGTYQIAATATGALTAAGQEVSIESLDGNLTNGRLTIGELVAALEQGTVRASGFADLGGPSGAEHFFDVELDHVAPSPFVPRSYAGWVPAEVSGTLHLEGGSLRALDTTVRGALSVRGAPWRRVAGLDRNARVELVAQLARTQARVERLSLTTRQGAVEARGTVPLAAGGATDLRLQASLGKARVELGRARHLRWNKLGLRAHVAGTLGDPVLTGTLRAAGVGSEQLPALDLDLPLALRRGTLSTDGGRIVTPGGTLRLDASLGLLARGGGLRKELPVRAVLTGRGVRAAKLTPQARGELALTARVRGTLRSPEARVWATVKHGELREVPFRRLSARLGVSLRQLRVERLAVRFDGGAVLTGHGTVSLEGRRALDLQIAAEGVALDWVERLAGTRTGATGEISLRGSVAGTAARPVGRVTLRGTKLALGKSALGDLQAEAVAKSRVVELTATLEGAAGHLSVDGTLEPETKKVHGVLVGRDIPVDLVERLSGRQPRAGGVLKMRLEAEGPLRWPRLSGAMEVEGVTLAGEPLGERTLTASVSTTDGAPGAPTYRIQAKLAPVLELEGSLSPEPLRVAVQGRFSELALGALLPSEARKQASFIIGGETRLSYERAAAAGPLGGVEGFVRLDTLRATAAGQTLRLLEPTTLTLHDGVARLTETRLESKSARLTLAATVDNEVEASAYGDVDLALLAPFVPALTYASGRMGLDLAVTGELSQPRLQGLLSVREPLVLRGRGYSEEVRIETGTIRLDQQQVVVEHVSGRVGIGAFAMQGTIGLERFMPARWNLAVQAESLALRTPTLQVEANADVNLHGEGAIPDVRGKVQITRGRYLREFELKALSLISRAPEIQTAPLSETAPWLSEIALDLRATSAAPVEVQVGGAGLGVELDLAVELNVKGTALAPVLDGRVYAESGTISFPAAKLDVLSAGVDFTPKGTSQFDTRVSLQADGEVSPSAMSASGISTYFVRMSLDGTLQQLKLDLQSNPPLSNADAMALLITGRTGETALAGEATGIGRFGTALSLAGSNLTGPLTGYVEQQLENALNLKLQLGTEVSATGFRITASQELTQRLTLQGWYEYSSFVGASLTGVKAQLLLSDRLFLEGGAQQLLQTPSLQWQGYQSGEEIELKYRLIGE